MWFALAVRVTSNLIPGLYGGCPTPQRRGQNAVCELKNISLHIKCSSYSYDPLHKNDTDKTPRLIYLYLRMHWSKFVSPSAPPWAASPFLITLQHHFVIWTFHLSSFFFKDWWSQGPQQKPKKLDLSSPWLKSICTRSGSCGRRM